MHPLIFLTKHYFFGTPAALYGMAKADEIESFPLLAATRDDDHRMRMDFDFIEADTLPPVRVRKADGEPAVLSFYVRMPNDLNEDTVPEVVVRDQPGGDRLSTEKVRIEKEQMWRSKSSGRNDPRRWHLELTLPADAEEYLIEFPGAATITLLESTAESAHLEQ